VTGSFHQTPITVRSYFTNMKKSRADKIRGMLAIIQSKIFYVPVSYKKNLTIKIYKTVTLPVVLYGCETLWGRNID
jgi:hypothetical protein